MNKIKENKRIRIIKALAHEERFRILELISKNPMCVCELNEMSEYSQSNISQHLKILRDADLIYPEKDGNKVNYYLADKKIIDLIKTINNLV
ncbi:ArsR/SmtB family transcription factor [Geotoga petraea]|jgi:ArsR family transcriptional regulator|uniref:ArsR family transcriptional regulator n=1 Tax=Geotoga petraea TaxID=28234 RepID=A0A1G6HNB8_9BACT|nr:metalloregulator ArsR/SmtB family transcription factor [Geotoga petraea]SDB95694.1 ArsR family transcriptional regulator [Geotoga petraea]